MTVAKVTKGSLITDGVNLDRNDIVYTPLPLYHSAASLIAFGGTVRAGKFFMVLILVLHS